MTAKNPTGRPVADTLTDRYVWAVLKSLPEAKRADIDRELRATIADDIEAREADGRDAATAEREALLELGDPARLAAGYAGRSLTLIGPALYLDWWRLLKLLLVIVLPIVAATMFLVNLLGGEGIGSAIGALASVTLTVGVHLCFWVTLVFVILERTGTAASMRGTGSGIGDDFDPKALDAVPTSEGGSRSELVASLVFLALVPVAIVWQQVWPMGDAAWGPAPFFDPALWSFWLPYLMVMVLLGAGFAILLYRAGGWNWPLVAVNAVIGIASTVPFAWLAATGRLLNPEFLDRLDWEDAFTAGSAISTIVAVSLVGILVWSVIDSVVKAWRSDRARRVAA